MSIKSCIDNLVTAREITLEEGQQIQRRFDDLFRKLNSRGAARQQLTAELAAEAREQKRRANLTEARRQVLADAILQHRDAKGRPNPAEALQMLMISKGGARFMDADTLGKVIAAEAHAKLGSLLREGRKGFVTGDFRRRFGKAKARQENIVRVLFGEQPKGDDPAAKVFARAAAEVMEDLRQAFNGAGGAIAKLDTWGLPQHHDARLVLEAGRAQWVKEVFDALDRDRMRNAATGEPMTDDELRTALADVYETITTGGANKLEPSGQPIGKALFRRHQDHRFLHFKNADAWLAYQQRYGRMDAHAAIMSHISSMSRDIAAMRIFGPNPEAMRTYLKQLVSKHAAMVRPFEAMLAEQTEEMRRLAMSLTRPNPDYQKLSGEMEAVGREIYSLRWSKAGRRWAVERRRMEIDGAAMSKAAAETGARLDALDQRLAEITGALGPYWRGEADGSVEDAGVAQQMQALLADMQKTSRTVDALVVPPGARPEDAATAGIERFDRLWEAFTGSSNVPTNEFVAQASQSVRNLMTAEAMGSASITALSDMGRQKMARQFAGMQKRGLLGIMNDYVSFMRRAPREEAIAAELLLDEALHVGNAQARFGGVIGTRTMTGFFADRVLAVSGLNWFTQTGKHVHGMALQIDFWRARGQAFAELSEGQRLTLERHGITAADWDRVRAVPGHMPREGVGMMRPKEIREAAGIAASREDRTPEQAAYAELAERWQIMIMREVANTIPEAGLEWKAAMARFGRPGTWSREIAAFGLQFKSFGITVIMLDAARIMREVGAGRAGRGVSYLAGILFFMSLFGGLSLQLKEIARGRDPRDMTNWKFWTNALMQGGGLGIFGDFLFADYNRAGGGLTGTIAGPLAGKIERLGRATFGQAERGMEGEKTNPGRAAMSVLRDWDVGGSLWFTRLAYERGVLDQLQLMADPEARRAFHRTVTNQRRDYGNRYFAPPGRGFERAPDLGSAFGR